ncbi:MAG: hypothetical protein QXS68_06570 [Candidatus Methanomethylicaceae archaeon]
MNIPKYRLEIYLPHLKNPNTQGKREKQPGRLLKRIRDEVREYFRELGFTLNMGSIGVFRGQVEPQDIFQIDVFLKPEDIEWLNRKKVE